MAKTKCTPTVDSLQREISRLHNQINKRAAERDYARQQVVAKAQVALTNREAMYRYCGQYLPSDFIVSIRQGIMTFEQAVEQRDQRWPIFRYAGGDGLEQAYQEAA